MSTKKKRRKTPEDYHALAESRGFRWLGPEVSTTKTRTTWECPKGHTWQAIYNNIQQGRDCPHCPRRKSEADYHFIARKRNLQWLGPPVNSIDAPTTWKCQQGHQWQASYRNLLRRDECPDCLENPSEMPNQLTAKPDDLPIQENIDEQALPETPLEVDEIDPETLSFDWWDKKSIDFLKKFFIIAKSLIRVSTGFFSIQGYSLLKGFITDKRFYILVGYDERSKRDLKIALIDEIMDDLSRWHENRRETVLNLVQKLEKDEFRMIDARTRKKDHSKIYIFDEDYVVIGSTNLTKSGLLHNREGDTAISRKDMPNKIVWWCEQYEMYWNAPDTDDISQLLLERLKSWLELCDPWDIYLKTIQILTPDDMPTTPRENYKTPVEYQMVVIKRAIRQLQEWRGAMIVASTGLGKTIMATHIAYELANENRIKNVMVIAPKPVKKEWRKRLRSAGVSYDIFTRDLLDKSDKNKRQSALNEVLEALSEIDDKWLIIIDESQYFKNRERGIGGQRHSFTRLIETINEKKCKVLLLTATPYATELDNINHQLLLLPHTSPKKKTHQQRLPGFETEKLYLRSWWVNRVDDLVNLEVGTVINTPYVAEHFAIKSDEGDYLMFGDTKKYIPKIELHKIDVPLLMEETISSVLNMGYFRHETAHFKSRGQWIRTDKNIEKEVMIAWGSSSWALKDVIEKTVAQQGGYEVKFIFSQEERYQNLFPILNDLCNLSYHEDEKFIRLYLLLKQLRQEGHKVLIFSERHSTAMYIETGLLSLMPHLRIANTIKQEENKFSQKDIKDVRDLMIGFAPHSNSKDDGTIPEDKYDVFITTDAYSQGINLQDASVVIHYDIAWTPDIIIQRAGRILRFWPEPRMVELYLFAGVYQIDKNREAERLNIQNRLKKLKIRTKEAEKFTEITTIPEDTEKFETLRGLSSITIESLGQIDTQNLEDERMDVSPFLVHLTQLKKNSKYAKTIPNDISSALTVKRIRKPQLYTLIRHKKKYHWMLYDINNKKIMRIEEDKLLDRIKCLPETAPALVNETEIEEHRQACINLWCQKKKLDDTERLEIKHICSLYLLPEDKGVSDLLEESTQEGDTKT